MHTRDISEDFVCFDHAAEDGHNNKLKRMLFVYLDADRVKTTFAR